MSLPDLKYSYNDALLTAFELEPSHHLTLHVAVYGDCYSHGPRVRIRFEDVANWEAIAAYFAVLEQPDDEDNGYERIEVLQYDTKRESAAGNLCFFLLLDWEGPLKIRCRSLTISEPQA